jgi:hypothetical protein
MEYYTGNVMSERIIPIPIPGFMNTFQRTDTEEERRREQDNYGRRTRTPAPRANRNTRNNGSNRRRSGESVEETQFTNANN